MLFHTWTFAIFFVVLYVLYVPLRHTRFQIPLLFTASYIFYGWWDPLYLILIFGCTALNYYAVALMEDTRFRKTWFTVAIVGSLSVLFFYKYGNFATDNLNALLLKLGAGFRAPSPQSLSDFTVAKLNALLALVGLHYQVPKLTIMLPVGISFFTFQAMSYTIDRYRGQVDREHSFFRFATFVSLFPQLVAGPIERASNLLPQLHEPRKITRVDITDGLSLFVVGLFKKIALADYLSMYVDKIYLMPEDHRAPALLLATFAFGWQIYFDFSGYTDMARGVARMMGYRLMLNFNNPYLATGLGEFWQRWHISLSTWFKDYVYIPLGGNRHGTVRTYVNMVLTMLISGLWHGAAWTFVIWGAIHAFGRILTRGLEHTEFYRGKVPRFAKQVLTFVIVTFAWIFFRARTWDDACAVVKGMFTTGWTDPAFPLVALALILSIWVYQYICESRLQKLAQLAPVRVGLVVAMVLYMAIFAGGGAQAFIYFQF